MKNKEGKCGEKVVEIKKEIIEEVVVKKVVEKVVK